MSASARHILPSPIASMSEFRVGHGTALRISERRQGPSLGRSPWRPELPLFADSTRRRQRHRAALNDPTGFPGVCCR